MADSGRWVNLRCRDCGKKISYRKRRSRRCDYCSKEWKLDRKYAMAFTKHLISIGEVRRRPENCEQCGSDEYTTQLHHLDYKRPERILWLCPECHTRWHEQNGGARG